MGTKRHVSISRRYGMRTRINPRPESDRLNWNPTLSEINEDERLRQLAMKITPGPEELIKIRANLPKLTFDYDQGVEEAY